MKNKKPKTIASIEVVSRTKPIKGASFIEHAIIAGVKVIVTRDLFKEGDKCVLIRKGTKLPKWAETITAYPSGRHLLDNNYYVRQVKICNAVSDGLALHISIINAVEPDIITNAIPIGMDISHILNVMSAKDYHNRYANAKIIENKILKQQNQNDGSITPN